MQIGKWSKVGIRCLAIGSDATEMEEAEVAKAEEAVAEESVAAVALAEEEVTKLANIAKPVPSGDI